MKCSIVGCTNEASFIITYKSNDDRTTIQEYRCSSHISTKKRDIRENKMAFTTGKSLENIRLKTRNQLKKGKK